MTARNPAAEDRSFEELLARLEEIVGLLEGGESPLEDGLALFEEGVVLSRRCHELLATAEKKVSRLIREEEGGFTLELFPQAEGEDE